MKLKDQRELLKTYAQEQQEEDSAMADVIPITDENGNPIDPVTGKPTVPKPTNVPIPAPAA